MNSSKEQFDDVLYSRMYPDVALSGLPPRVHYERYGRLLGRATSELGDNAPNAKSNNRLPDISGVAPSELDRQYRKGILQNSAPTKHQETVTIIIPSYNNERWIRSAIYSALSQEGVNTEVIVVDDGSTDGSVAVARAISADFANLRVVSLLRNFGCYYARNIGVTHAKGTYVTIIDSDDIVTPDRISRQLDAIKDTPGAIACRCLQRRWTADFTTPLGELKPGENSLLWHRDLVGSIGWYDSVRYSADAEFRLRIQRTLGADAVVILPEELYFLRTLQGSLTTTRDSQIYSIEGNGLQVSISKSRKLYLEAFTDWQKAKKPKKPGASHQMKIGFPLFTRPFSLGAPEQAASPSLGQARVGTMASFPPRAESLKVAVESILPQLDQLIVYLNNYDAIPDCLISEKVSVIRSQEQSSGDLRDNGKFFSTSSLNDAYIFTLDDDLIYPSDYVSRMVHSIEMLGRSCVVGLHGVIFPDGEFTALEQRQVFFYAHEQSGSFVDLLGTGTTAWHSSTLNVGLSDFLTKGVADMWFAAAASKQGIPLFSIARRKNWLKAVARFEESLYREALAEPTAYFNVYEQHLKPALQGGKTRLRAEAQLTQAFDADTLAAAGVVSQNSAPRRVEIGTPVRKSVQICAPNSEAAAVAELHFHLIVNGWNCVEYVDGCLRSIALQHPGPFTFEVTLVDDGSDDGTYRKLVTAAILPTARLIRISQNMGPAYARHVAIQSIRDPETIVVLLDMDDALEPEALSTVASRYAANARCLLTIGNWRDQHGKRNPQPFYTNAEIDEQRVRDVELFNATHLRTFRRKLYDAVRDEDLHDHNGDWLTTCTDVALMYSLIDQCWSPEIEFIHEPIYRYNRQHGNGTLARFGKPHKLERLAWLKSKMPKPRLHPDRDGPRALAWKVTASSGT